MLLSLLRLNDCVVLSALVIALGLGTTVTSVHANESSTVKQCFQGQSKDLPSLSASECANLTGIVKSLNLARDCDAHENRVVNMTGYSYAKCNTSLIKSLRAGLHGNYASVLMTPLLFPMGSQRLGSVDLSYARLLYKKKFSEITESTTHNPDSNTYTEYKTTEAVMFVDDFCPPGKLDFLYKLFESKNMLSLLNLYKSSCDEDSVLRGLAKLRKESF